MTTVWLVIVGGRGVGGGKRRVWGINGDGKHQKNKNNLKKKKNNQKLLHKKRFFHQFFRLLLSIFYHSYTFC